MNLVESERTVALRKALSLPLPDAAYEIVCYNYRVSSWPEAKIELAELELKGSAAELAEWERRSQQLRHDAYDVGDAALRNDGSYEAARALFERANPGFGQTSYKDAIRFRVQQAR